MTTTSPTLPLDSYRTAVGLDVPFVPAAPPAAADRLGETARTALRLLADDAAAGRLGLRPGQLERPDDLDGVSARRVLRALLTVREPGPWPRGAVDALDALLGGERQTRPVVDVRGLPTIAQTVPDAMFRAADETVLWQGDIVSLATDAIVNAANSALLGCFRPLHPCVDNAIHTAAGPRLRDDCRTIMTLQGGEEPTGTAKITRGYHLPARYVLHTVGPIVDGPPSPAHERLLAAAYHSCLDTAARVDSVRTLAFCAISTGVFGYPKESAARCALRAVGDWLAEHPGRFDRVVFTVFGDDDQRACRRALTEEISTP